MKKGLSLLLLIFILNIGCTSTGFLGLAKESYAKELEEENTKLKEDLEQVKDDMEKVLELAKEIEELEEITREVESKLDDLPETTLRKLVTILEEYLDKKSRIKDREIEDKIDESVEEDVE